MSFNFLYAIRSRKIYMDDSRVLQRRSRMRNHVRFVQQEFVYQHAQVEKRRGHEMHSGGRQSHTVHVAGE